MTSVRDANPPQGSIDIGIVCDYIANNIRQTNMVRIQLGDYTNAQLTDFLTKYISPVMTTSGIENVIIPPNTTAILFDSDTFMGNSITVVNDSQEIAQLCLGRIPFSAGNTQIKKADNDNFNKAQKDYCDKMIKQTLASGGSYADCQQTNTWKGRIKSIRVKSNLDSSTPSTPLPTPIGLPGNTTNTPVTTPVVTTPTTSSTSFDIMGYVQQYYLYILALVILLIVMSISSSLIIFMRRRR